VVVVGAGQATYISVPRALELLGRLVVRDLDDT
jgi:hypothetical protein